MASAAGTAWSVVVDNDRKGEAVGEDMLEGWTPLPDEASRRYRDAGLFEDHTIGEILDRAAARFGARPAIVFGSRSISYAEVLERTERLADHFVRLGLRPDDRVVVQLPNVPEFVYVYFALVK